MEKASCKKLLACLVMGLLMSLPVSGMDKRVKISDCIEKIQKVGLPILVCFVLMMGDRGEESLENIVLPLIFIISSQLSGDKIIKMLKAGGLGMLGSFFAKLIPGVATQNPNEIVSCVQYNSHCYVNTLKLDRSGISSFDVKQFLGKCLEKICAPRQVSDGGFMPLINFSYANDTSNTTFYEPILSGYPISVLTPAQLAVLFGFVSVEVFCLIFCCICGRPFCLTLLEIIRARRRFGVEFEDVTDSSSDSGDDGEESEEERDSADGSFGSESYSSEGE